MFPFKPRDPTNGRARRRNQQTRRRSNRNSINGCKIIDKEGKVKNVLEGGGPVERAVTKDLLNFYNTIYSCEKSKNAPTIGSAFQRYKNCYKDVKMGVLISGRYCPPRCDRNDYSQLLYSTCLSFLERSFQVNSNTTTSTTNVSNNNNRSNQNIIDMKLAAFAIFTLYTFYETNPLPKFPTQYFQHSNHDDDSQQQEDDNLSSSQHHQKRRKKGVVFDHLNQLNGEGEREALTTLTMGVVASIGDNTNGIYRRSYKSPIRISTFQYLLMQIVRDASHHYINYAAGGSDETLPQDIIFILDKLQSNQSFDFTEYSGPGSIEGLAGSPYYFQLHKLDDTTSSSDPQKRYNHHFHTSDYWNNLPTTFIIDSSNTYTNSDIHKNKIPFMTNSIKVTTHPSMSDKNSESYKTKNGKEDTVQTESDDINDAIPYLKQLEQSYQNYNQLLQEIPKTLAATSNKPTMTKLNQRKNNILQSSNISNCENENNISFQQTQHIKRILKPLLSPTSLSKSENDQIRNINNDNNQSLHSDTLSMLQSLARKISLERNGNITNESQNSKPARNNKNVQFYKNIFQKLRQQEQRHSSFVTLNKRNLLREKQYLQNKSDFLLDDTTNRKPIPDNKPFHASLSSNTDNDNISLNRDNKNNDDEHLTVIKEDMQFPSSMPHSLKVGICNALKKYSQIYNKDQKQENIPECGNQSECNGNSHATDTNSLIKSQTHKNGKSIHIQSKIVTLDKLRIGSNKKKMTKEQLLLPHDSQNNLKESIYGVTEDDFLFVDDFLKMENDKANEDYKIQSTNTQNKNDLKVPSKEEYMEENQGFIENDIETILSNWTEHDQLHSFMLDSNEKYDYDSDDESKHEEGKRALRKLLLDTEKLTSQPNKSNVPRSKNNNKKEKPVKKVLINPSNSSLNEVKNKSVSAGLITDLNSLASVEQSGIRAINALLTSVNCKQKSRKTKNISTKSKRNQSAASRNYQKKRIGDSKKYKKENTVLNMKKVPTADETYQLVKKIDQNIQYLSDNELGTVNSQWTDDLTVNNEGKRSLQKLLSFAKIPHKQRDTTLEKTNTKIARPNHPELELRKSNNDSLFDENTINTMFTEQYSFNSIEQSGAQALHQLLSNIKQKQKHNHRQQNQKSEPTKNLNIMVRSKCRKKNDDDFQNQIGNNLDIMDSKWALQMPHDEEMVVSRKPGSSISVPTNQKTLTKNNENRTREKLLKPKLSDGIEMITPEVHENTVFGGIISSDIDKKVERQDIKKMRLNPNNLTKGANVSVLRQQSGHNNIRIDENNVNVQCTDLNSLASMEQAGGQALRALLTNAMNKIQNEVHTTSKKKSPVKLRRKTSKNGRKQNSEIFDDVDGMTCMTSLEGVGTTEIDFMRIESNRKRLNKNQDSGTVPKKRKLKNKKLFRKEMKQAKVGQRDNWIERDLEDQHHVKASCVFDVVSLASGIDEPGTSALHSLLHRACTE